MGLTDTQISRHVVPAACRLIGAVRSGTSDDVMTESSVVQMPGMELRGRIRLALSPAGHRGHSAETARLMERALRGESIEQLAADQRRTTRGA